MLAALLFAFISCGGADKSFNQQYNIKDGHAKTEQCIGMVKDMLAKDLPNAKIKKYTDVSDITTENATYHYMVVQLEDNGRLDNVDFYFPNDYSFVTKKIENLISPESWQ